MAIHILPINPYSFGVDARTAVGQKFNHFSDSNTPATTFFANIIKQFFELRWLWKLKVLLGDLNPLQVDSWIFEWIPTVFLVHSQPAINHHSECPYGVVEIVAGNFVTQISSPIGTFLGGDFI